ncbi:hypothetical protein AGROH133_15343 (plasmid) [Agrobacterium tumefaciens]|nr:hypothetical protein AGROH133_15343 [Agrobacterium tumefaciens]
MARFMTGLMEQWPCLLGKTCRWQPFGLPGVGAVFRHYRKVAFDRK